MNGLSWKRFLPVYDEFSLFLIGLSFITLIFVGNGFSEMLGEVLAPLNGFLFIGSFIAIFYGFSSKPISLGEKVILLWYAIFVNACAAISATIYILTSQPSVLLIFPIINSIQAITFIVLLRMNHITIDSISDKNVSLMKIIPSAVLLIMILLVCGLWLDLYWAISFSIAVGYISSFEKSVREIFKV